MILIAAVIAGGCSTLWRDELSGSSRRVLSLDGTWQVAEGNMDQVPTKFEHKVPVPGLVSLAQPAFIEPGPVVKDRQSLAQTDARREAFWYRNTFQLDKTNMAVATLKIGKAMFGTRVVLNGKVLGDHLPSFTPGYFDAHNALKPGENELLVRVGAARGSLPRSIPDGFDFEKTRYIPGIFDSVELILCGTPNILNLQVAPDLSNHIVRVQTRLHNAGPEVATAVHFTVKEVKSGKIVATCSSQSASIPRDSEGAVEVRIPMPNCHTWSPEDPFLYCIEADTGADQFKTEFGIRTFTFDPKTKTALLNGKPYFMRGSNITLYRFFEDPECNELPWNPAWVRLLHRRVKEMHWNCVRYCIGFPPESWYRIADEEGVLIQDEFPIWYGGPGWSKWPKELKSTELSKEYTEWMQERWNHPSVVIWDASNETSTEETGIAVQQVRQLDLSRRPWDNSYGTPRVPGDVFESHPYHFQNPKYQLKDIAKESGVPQGNALPNPGDSPVIINEYGWLWLNRDGTPTTLTETLYENLLGTNSSTTTRRHLYARYLAAESEFWRSHRQAAAVMHFTTLGYSRPGGQTSDHWLNIAKLQWEPEFFKYVGDAFAPIGLMIDDWAEAYPAGQAHSFTLVGINDLNRSWEGIISVRLLRGGHLIQEKKLGISILALGKTSHKAVIELPSEAGNYELDAVLQATPFGDIHGRREFALVSQGVPSVAQDRGGSQ